jgi:hypothetical protein
MSSKLSQLSTFQITIYFFYINYDIFMSAPCIQFLTGYETSNIFRNSCYIPSNFYLT